MRGPLSPSRASDATYHIYLMLTVEGFVPPYVRHARGRKVAHVCTLFTAHPEERRRDDRREASLPEHTVNDASAPPRGDRERVRSLGRRQFPLPQAEAASVAAVRATVLRDLDELADQPWQPRAASLRGRLSALFGRCRSDLGVSRRVAPLRACLGGGLSARAARAGDADGLYR